MSRLFNRLASVRLTAWLFGGMLVSLVISFLVPQREIVGGEVYADWLRDTGLLGSVAESLAMHRIFYSWPFLLLMGLLGLNLLFCTLRRLRSQTRQRVPRTLVAPASAETIEIAAAMDLDGTLAAVMPRWKVHRPGDRQWLFVRGDLGRWGSLFAHLGMLLVIVAGVVSGLTRFSGELVIIEGQTVVDSADHYISVSQTPALGGGFTGAELTMHEASFTYDGDVVTDAVAVMSDAAGGPVREVRVNRPFRTQGKAYLLYSSGLAVPLRVTAGERVLLDAVVSLGEQVPEGFSDTVVLADGRNMRITAVPDSSVPAGDTVARRMDVVAPEVRMSIDDGEVFAVAAGQQEAVDGASVQVDGIRYWNSFLARSDKGLPIAYVAFAMVMAGMLVRWLDVDTRVAVVVDDDGDLRVWGRSTLGSGASDRAIASIRRELATTQDCET